MRILKYLGLIAGLLVTTHVFGANDSMNAFTIESSNGESQAVSINLQILAIMTALTLLPAVILAMTSFTRIVVVLAIVRQALGMPTTPSNQILVGLSLFLTFFVMAPVFNQIHADAINPYLHENLPFEQAVEHAIVPVKQFMLAETRKADISMFSEISGKSIDPNDVPMSHLMPAFLCSELKTAFQIGFMIFIPFLVIDLVVASVLMSMGMMMLSPLVVSLPFKIMLFVLIDGWSLLLGTLAGSFNHPLS